mmetsp:Transcript_42128/g.86081  ORF Transcript_42128/g.86081 Transcript_42128/m.86081 type:complete len:235 (+) Transcript_42128:198-902(+)
MTSVSTSSEWKRERLKFLRRRRAARRRRNTILRFCAVTAITRLCSSSSSRSILWNSNMSAVSRFVSPIPKMMYASVSHSDTPVRHVGEKSAAFGELSTAASTSPQLEPIESWNMEMIAEDAQSKLGIRRAHCFAWHTFPASISMVLVPKKYVIVSISPPMCAITGPTCVTEVSVRRASALCRTMRVSLAASDARITCLHGTAQVKQEPLSFPGCHAPGHGRSSTQATTDTAMMA